MLTVVVQNSTQKRLNDRPGIVRLNHDDPPFPNGDRIGARNGESALLRQANPERLERSLTRSLMELS
jgi:hypothetical protein